MITLFYSRQKLLSISLKKFNSGISSFCLFDLLYCTKSEVILFKINKNKISKEA